jgi:hypothetical protein
MKLYIEDLMCRLGNQGAYIFSPSSAKVSSFDIGIVSNIAMACDTNRGLTQKQRAVSVKLCQRYRSQLISLLGQDAATAIGMEEFKSPLLEAYIPESSVVIKDRKISVKFPYNQDIVTSLKKYKSEFAGHTVQWNIESKSWDFDLEESNIIWLQNNIVNQNFSIDPKFSEFYEKIAEVFDQLDSHVPCLILTGDQFTFKNVHHTVPQLATTDIKEALVMARLYGITAWDENVEKMIKNQNFSPLFESFLTKTDKKIIEFDPETFSIDQFTDLFKYNLPVLIVVPGGQELQCLRTWYFWLKLQNFEENDISVMFRLDNGNGSAFNDIVKEYKLNNPITENTKVVFISQKLPKPVVKSGIEFKFVINLSATWSSHYSINSYLDTLTDVIRYAPTKKEGKTIEFL